MMTKAALVREFAVILAVVAFVMTGKIWEVIAWMGTVLK